MPDDGSHCEGTKGMAHHLFFCIPNNSAASIVHGAAYLCVLLCRLCHDSPAVSGTINVTIFVLKPFELAPSLSLQAKRC